MYLVGFYSPHKDSGVSQTALKVAKCLKENTDLSIAVVSNDDVRLGPNEELTVHEFKAMLLNDSQEKVTEYKDSFDIVILDVTSGLSSDSLKLLPTVDRLFVVGHDDPAFVETLNKVIGFNRVFDRTSRYLVNQLHNAGKYVMRNDQERIGFAQPQDDVDDICREIKDDYAIYYINQHYINRYNQLLAALKNVPVEELSHKAYELGIGFEKAFLLKKFVQLREMAGQPYTEAMESILGTVLRNDYGVLYQQFQDEAAIGRVSFTKPNPEVAKIADKELQEVQ
jgi:hypothetical protein